MRSVYFLMLAALVLSGCGAVGGGAAPPTGGPFIHPGAGFDVTVTENTHAVTLRVGQTLAVVLHARPGMTSWNGVRSTDQSVLEPMINPAASPARGDTLAAFKAIAPGRATIDTSAGPLCSPGMACPAYLMVLTIDVSVNAG